jgi:hypothetical protein
VPEIAEPGVHDDGAIAFDLAIERLTPWIAYERCAGQRENLELLRQAPADNADTLALAEECLTWASGGLAAALLVAEAVTETRSGPLDEVDAIADTLSHLVDALLVREFQQAECHLDALIERQFAVQDYHAKVVPDSTKELFRREATASEARSLDKLAIDGTPRRVRQPKRPDAEPPDSETLVW